MNAWLERKARIEAAKRKKNRAHGASRGKRWGDRASPERAQETPSIPAVFFFVLDSVFPQKFHVLFLERSPALVFLLLRDIFHHCRHAGLAYAEGSVSRLPCEGHMLRPFFMSPTRGISLENSCPLGNRTDRRDANQPVNMIRCTVHDQRDPMHCANDAAHVGEQVALDFRRNRRVPRFSAEDEMDQKICRRMRQFLTLLRSLVRDFAFAPRLTPWASFLRHLRLSGHVGFELRLRYHSLGTICCR